MINCKACRLHTTRRQVVIGRGDPRRARFVFLGEGPGRSEDLLGRAFCGPSGQLLDDMIEASGGNVDNCFFTNVVLCHPTDDFAGENREPYSDEVLACTPNVMSLLRSDVHVVFVGKVAERYYKKEFADAISITHPAALLRTGGRASSFWQMNVNALTALFKGGTT